MSPRSWKSLKADAAARLKAVCPLAEGHPVTFAALVTIVALAEADFSVQSNDGRLEAAVHVSPPVETDPLASELVGMIAATVTQHATAWRPEHAPALGDWIEERGFSAMNVALLSSDAKARAVTAAAEIVAAAIAKLGERSRALGETHMGNILARDLPDGVFLRHNLTSVAEWLLAPETSDSPKRGEVLVRRKQAMSIYGALSGTLRDGSVTAAIDVGSPLAPILMARHGLSPAELRVLRNARSFRKTIENPTDFHVAVEELKAHEVPLHQWPDSRQSGGGDAWEASEWVKGPRQNFVRPDFFEPARQGVIDAVNGLREDILRPLVADRIRQGEYKSNRYISTFARSVELDSGWKNSPQRRILLAAIRNAIVGMRKVKAFQEAVGLWHRRVASLSALRHERMAERPGWPPLCAPWRSPCGRYEVVVLASAADLVEEGRLLDHCVGGYYDICRRGDTQILSMREDGRRVATVELTLGPDLSTFSIEVGQFKAWRNRAPSVTLHDPLRAFLRAIRSGDHPVDTAGLTRYRKKMRNVWDGTWVSETPSLAHARELFEFYLPLLPRGTPADLDAWAAMSGLTGAIDATLAFLDAPSA